MLQSFFTIRPFSDGVDHIVNAEQIHQRARPKIIKDIMKTMEYKVS